MKILAVDIGTGTQDIFLYDSRLEVENGFKLILPSPTMMVHRQIKEATKAKRGIVLTGTTMGGGPSQWAAEDHVRAGLPVYATPEAARSFNDDLAVIREMGIEVVSEEEAAALPENVGRVALIDFDFGKIADTFAAYGVALDDLSAVAVAVFDHGNAPPDVSDRQYRFDYLDERIRAQNSLSAFAYLAEDIPPDMTRLAAVAETAAVGDVPLVVMDTAPAAVLGATFDPLVRQRQRLMIANVGNLHTLAFRLGSDGIEGVFEHHTGFLDREKLDALLMSLAAGKLRHEDVFGAHGHGALVYVDEPLVLDDGDFGVVVTGPRRKMTSGSALRPYFAAPFGDMMIGGCFGLLAAAAELIPSIRDEVTASLSNAAESGVPPWEISV